MSQTELKDIKEFVKEWKNNLAKEIVANNIITPSLGIIQVGNNEASNRYVRNKIKDCEEVGIVVNLAQLDNDISEESFIECLKIMANSSDGIIVQLPIPCQLQNIVSHIYNYIPDNKDVDGFNPTSKFYPCTPAGILKYLEYCNINLDGMNVLVIGRSEIVGKPMAKILTKYNATVTLAHSHTKNLQDHIDKADLIICAVGQASFLNCAQIDVPVIDVGINFVNNYMVGDCYNTNNNVTPVPGGVGLLTRCALLQNTIDAYKINHML